MLVIWDEDKHFSCISTQVYSTHSSLPALLHEISVWDSSFWSLMAVPCGRAKMCCTAVLNHPCSLTHPSAPVCSAPNDCDRQSQGVQGDHLQPVPATVWTDWIRTSTLQNKEQCVRLQVYKKHDCILQMLLSLFTKGSRVSGEQPRQGWTSRFGNWYASSVDTC